ncbi:hypothetical protein Xaut_4458 [Xanthobacter versatilis]|uniref:Uncharacterized protein n=1 Tax=Xanthobacter autotrophicus (strain ATCC BAA-1158 / Py2) TaxID=78245 RepID=A7INT3_XANP2|nr:hypothetical protein Xaut_4458 [Xanthobacter autotrophicus Py2]
MVKPLGDPPATAERWGLAHPHHGLLKAAEQIDHRNRDQKNGESGTRDAPAGAAMGIALAQIHDGIIDLFTCPRGTRCVAHCTMIKVL